MTIGTELRGFADDPMASLSGRFPLGSPAGTPASMDVPSTVGLRPWGLRNLTDARPARQNAPTVRYDAVRQLGVGPDGTVAARNHGGPPTANTTSSVDGEDPPSSEDWNNDFHEDGPFQP
jgi:putative ATP-grasp target RiPP